MVKRKNDNEHESRLDYDQAGAVEEQSASGGGGTFAKADSATLASRRRVHATVVHAGGRGSRAYRKHNYLKELTKLNAKFKTFVEAKLAEVQAEIDSGNIPGGEPRFYLDAAAQYTAAVKEIRDRYMPAIGDVLAVGTGEAGQLGVEEEDLNDMYTIYRPRLIRNLRGADIVQLSAGAQYNIALTEEGKVYTWGCNDEGAMGQLDYSVSGTPGKIDTGWVPNLVKGFLPTPVPDGVTFLDRPDAQIVAVAAGDCHGAALSTDGDVYWWGSYRDRDGKKWRGIVHPQDTRVSWEVDLRSTDDKEEGRPPERPPRGIQWFPVKIDGLPKKAIKIACTASAMLAILEDGTLWSWGLGETGEMGRPTPKIRDDAGDYNCDFIKNILFVPTQVKFGEPGDGVYERCVVNVGCGLYHTLVVVREHCAKYPRGRHVVYSMGVCNYGQLGQGFHDTAETKAAAVAGEGEKDAHPIPTRIKELDNCDIRLVAGGEHHSLVADATGRNLYAFGRGDTGQLGHEDRPGIDTQEDSPVPVYLDWENKTNPVIKSLDCGLANSFAVCEDGTAYSWGEGETGALAHGRIKKQGVSDDENVPDHQFRPKKIVFKKSKQEKVEGDTKIHMISVGATHSVILISQSQEL
eukprot:CAMPEP_0185799526 /NCGR_PEP_ID=MMETSP1322-20130828/370_1 /TAXON_ID=265543 /ORGANISM="Minutocellus polymorphus, Strain RCC2270" /LENGTH=631 /DNA_ID=CAMNT_0028495105 /DNA_START=45 /DNA_END=1940 /DNA_ORIENTATION=+